MADAALEKRIPCKQVAHFNDIGISKKPEIYLIANINHAIIVFPDRRIFNCNPRDYPLPINNKMLVGLKHEQVEPLLEEYESYWDNSMGGPVIENDQNCILWLAYYLEWYLSGNEGLFPCTLLDLEKWIIGRQ